MGTTTQVVVDNGNMGVAGLFLILLVAYIIYMCLSLYASYIRHKNLRTAATLIEEGHQRKIDDEVWAHETD